ncbi:MAG TPA: BNR repeat-containing protein [Chitinophagaceae bacterium]|nr:BNR repeat-containing protein [Chitinophagaceae bacterium]
MKHFVFFFLLLRSLQTEAQTDTLRLVPVAGGWAANSVNTVVFRKNALVSNDSLQFIAFYDAQGFVVLGRRRTGSDAWTMEQTPYKGNVADAHNAISIMLDGAGYLHLSWDHHNSPLRYARSRKPGGLELGEPMSMTGGQEESVSYPEFFALGGGLIFLYRDGSSGRGNLVVNRYDTATRQWSRVQTALIDGQGKRNAYWQAWVDQKEVLHLSWVWRESPDVSSNHDLCYARSEDGGKTWKRSDGTPYTLPITAATAEYAWRIPQGRELINQTSMTTNASGNPYIATYWRDSLSNVPQYRVVYHDGKGWKLYSFRFRNTPFSLSGVGTRSIPMARPQLLVRGKGKKTSLMLLFRDSERGERVSAARVRKLGKGTVILSDLTTGSVGSWEPVFDRRNYGSARANCTCSSSRYARPMGRA